MKNPLILSRAGGIGSFGWMLLLPLSSCDGSRVASWTGTPRHRRIPLMVFWRLSSTPFLQRFVGCRNTFLCCWFEPLVGLPLQTAHFLRCWGWGIFLRVVFYLLFIPFSASNFLLFFVCRDEAWQLCEAAGSFCRIVWWVKPPRRGNPFTGWDCEPGCSTKKRTIRNLKWKSIYKRTFSLNKRKRNE
jgi:hypothetical protein